MKIRFSKWNILYTEGVRKGLTLKELQINIYLTKKILRIKIPYGIISYNRKYADYIHRLTEKIRKEYE